MAARRVSTSRGKRVGLIGTGSTGIQATPVIAETAAHLTVFQRTAELQRACAQRPADRRTSSGYVKENHDEIRRAMRSDGATGIRSRIEERTRLRCHDGGAGGHLRGSVGDGRPAIPGSFHDLVIDKEANDTAAEFVRDKIRETVKDPATADDAVPTWITPMRGSARRSTRITSRRSTATTSTLVDLRADADRARSPRLASRRADAEYELDIIVFATGFDAMTGPLLQASTSAAATAWPLAETWAGRPRNHLGLRSPASRTCSRSRARAARPCLCNMPVAIEQHVEWIAECIAHMRENGIDSHRGGGRSGGQVGRACQRGRRMQPCCRTRSIPGTSAPTSPASRACSCRMPAAWRTIATICDDVAAKGYEGFVMGRAQLKATVNDFSAGATIASPGV